MLEDFFLILGYKCTGEAERLYNINRHEHHESDLEGIYVDGVEMGPIDVSIAHKYWDRVLMDESTHVQIYRTDFDWVATDVLQIKADGGACVLDVITPPHVRVKGSESGPSWKAIIDGKLPAKSKKDDKSDGGIGGIGGPGAPVMVPIKDAWFEEDNGHDEDGDEFSSDCGSESEIDGGDSSSECSLPSVDGSSESEIDIEIKEDSESESEGGHGGGGGGGGPSEPVDPFANLGDFVVDPFECEVEFELKMEPSGKRMEETAFIRRPDGSKHVVGRISEMNAFQTASCRCLLHSRKVGDDRRTCGLLLNTDGETGWDGVRAAYQQWFKIGSNYKPDISLAQAKAVALLNVGIAVSQ